MLLLQNGVRIVSNMHTDEVLRECIDLVLESWPWFLEMRELIAECPNIIPSGIGNNMTGIDMSQYLPGSLESEMDFTNFDTNATSGNWSEINIKSRSTTPSGNQSDSSTSDDDVMPPKKKLKCNGKAVLKGVEKKTATCPGMSTPTATQKGSTSKAGKTVMDRFAETAKIEEETVQRQLELKKTRVLAQAEEKKAKIGVQKDIQMGRDWIKMEYKLKKEQMKIEFKLCHLGQFALQSSVGLSLSSMVPTFPTSSLPAHRPNYSSSMAPSTPIYSESYSMTSYPSQTGSHSSQSAPSIASGFSNEALQRSHTGSPVASGSMTVNRGVFDYEKFEYDPSIDAET
jgi:hypothetical protein